MEKKNEKMLQIVAKYKFFIIILNIFVQLIKNKNKFYEDVYRKYEFINAEFYLLITVKY